MGLTSSKQRAHTVLVKAARNGDTTAVRAGLKKLSPDTDSKTVAFDAVHEACRGNHDECLALLLPYVETTQMGFGMLLSECIHADHTACTEVLLQHWKSVCSKDAYVPHGQEHRACPAMWKDPAVCQVLIDAGADIEIEDGMGRPPLHWSCCSGALAVVKMLVEAGAAVRVTVCDCTCLNLAAYFGHTEIVRYLVGLKDVDVNHKAEHALFRVARRRNLLRNHADVVEVLIDAGADIEVNEDGSPLLAASSFGHLRVVEVLARAGAGVCVTDDKGLTCLMLAATFGHTETVRTLLCMPEVDVNQSDNSGNTPLHHAAMRQHLDVVQLLIDAGADIDAKNVHFYNGRGCTPLHYACAGGELDIVKMLVNAGADVSVADNNPGNTCLTLAAQKGHTETVRYLVGLNKVNVNYRNLLGHTALYWARKKQHTDVEQVLLKRGAEE